MIWLTWRQFRAQAVTAIAALAAFAVLLAFTGPHLASLYAASRISGCHSQSCGQLASNFLSQVGTGIYPAVYLLGIAGIVLAPAVIGIFWGAPLIARELETGTFRLAWTQSITRTRWLRLTLRRSMLSSRAIARWLWPASCQARKVRARVLLAWACVAARFPVPVCWHVLAGGTWFRAVTVDAVVACHACPVRR